MWTGKFNRGVGHLEDIACSKAHQTVTAADGRGHLVHMHSRKQHPTQVWATLATIQALSREPGTQPPFACKPEEWPPRTLGPSFEHAWPSLPEKPASQVPDDGCQQQGWQQPASSLVSTSPGARPRPAGVRACVHPIHGVRQRQATANPTHVHDICE